MLVPGGGKRYAVRAVAVALVVDVGAVRELQPDRRFDVVAGRLRKRRLQGAGARGLLPLSVDGNVLRRDQAAGRLRAGGGVLERRRSRGLLPRDVRFLRGRVGAESCEAGDGAAVPGRAVEEEAAQALRAVELVAHVLRGVLGLVRGPVRALRGRSGVLRVLRGGAQRRPRTEASVV